MYKVKVTAMCALLVFALVLCACAPQPENEQPSDGHVEAIEENIDLPDANGAQAEELDLLDEYWAYAIAYSTDGGESYKSYSEMTDEEYKEYLEWLKKRQTELAIESFEKLEKEK